MLEKIAATDFTPHYDRGAKPDPAQERYHRLESLAVKLHMLGFIPVANLIRARLDDECGVTRKREDKYYELADRTVKILELGHSVRAFAKVCDGCETMDDAIREMDRIIAERSKAAEN